VVQECNSRTGESNANEHTTITRHVQLLVQVKLKIKLKTKNLGNGLTQSMPGENPMQGKKTHTK